MHANEISRLAAGLELIVTGTPAAGAAPRDDRIRCDACPVMCVIRPGQAGACDRYANQGGALVRVDPHVILSRTVADGGRVVRFGAAEWDGTVVGEQQEFVTAIGAGTTYPDYKPAPFIVSSTVDGLDMVTVVTESVFSYCGAKVKIDTDRHIGPERALVRAEGGRWGTCPPASTGRRCCPWAAYTT